MAGGKSDHGQSHQSSHSTDTSTQSGGLPSTFEDHYHTIRTLYIEENRTLTDVMSIMKSCYGLYASMNMYKKKLRQWKLFKSTSTRIPDNTQPGNVPIKDAHVPRYEFVAVTMSSKTGRTKNVRQARANCAARQASLIRQHIQSQRIRQLEAPASYRVSEEMFYAIRSHIFQRLDLRLHPSGSSVQPQSLKHIPLESRRSLPAHPSLGLYGTAVGNAGEFFRNGHTSLAIALLERGLQHLEALVLDNHFSITFTCVEIFVELWHGNMQSFIPRVLGQIASVATRCHGRSHPLTIWARNLSQILNIDISYAEPIMKLCTDTMEEMLGLYDPYVATVKMISLHASCTIQTHKYGYMSIEGVKSTITAITSATPQIKAFLGYRLGHVSIAALILNKLGCYEETERLYRKTIPAGLEVDEFIEEGECRLHGIVSFAQALAGQGKVWSARRIYELIITRLKNTSGIDSPDTIDTLRQQGEFLAQVGLYDEAMAIQVEISQTLLPHVPKAQGIMSETDQTGG